MIVPRSYIPKALAWNEMRRNKTPGSASKSIMNFKALTFAAAVVVVSFAADGYSQEADSTPAPAPVPVEVKPERIGTRVVLESLKTPRTKLFELTDGRFRIDLPQKFLRYRPSQMFSQNATPRFGIIEWNLEEAEISIRFGMLPADTTAQASPTDRDRLMASILAGGLAEPEAARAYERNLTQGTLPARELKTIAKGQTMIARIILVGDDYYVLGASLRSAEDAEGLVKKAFDSFAPLR
jgi:hypothetical protein